MGSGVSRDAVACLPLDEDDFRPRDVGAGPLRDFDACLLLRANVCFLLSTDPTGAFDGFGFELSNDCVSVKLF